MILNCVPLLGFLIYLITFVKKRKIMNMYLKCQQIFQSKDSEEEAEIKRLLNKEDDVSLEADTSIINLKDLLSFNPHSDPKLITLVFLSGYSIAIVSSMARMEEIIKLNNEVRIL